MNRDKKEILVLDNDLLSSFLWVNREDIINKLYKDRMLLPKAVIVELNKVNHFRPKIKRLQREKKLRIRELSDVEKVDFNKNTKSDKKTSGIGKGEAAVIAIATSINKMNRTKGVIASNNLRDVSRYAKERKLKIMTTGNILMEAEKRGICNEKEIEGIWQDMIMKKRKIGAKSYKEFKELERKRVRRLNRKKNNDLQL